jgi:putative copper export protein
VSVDLVVLWLHVMGAVAWVGGLLHQAHVLLPLARGGHAPAVAEAARRARPVAWTALGLVVLTGFYNVTRLGPLEAVMGSGRGALLAGKFVLVVLALPFAADRDFKQVPALRARLEAGEDPGPTLRAIARRDRVVLLLALGIVYLGLAVSRG